MKNTGPSRVNQKAIRAALAVLGRTPEQIAAGLRKRRVTGQKNHILECPLACYLSRKFKTFDVSINGLVAEVQNSRHRLNRSQRSFVAQFDSDVFPQLVRV